MTDSNGPRTRSMKRSRKPFVRSNIKSSDVFSHRIPNPDHTKLKYILVAVDETKYTSCVKSLTNVVNTHPAQVMICNVDPTTNPHSRFVYNPLKVNDTKIINVIKEPITAQPLANESVSQIVKQLPSTSKTTNPTESSLSVSETSTPTPLDTSENPYADESGVLREEYAQFVVDTLYDFRAEHRNEILERAKLVMPNYYLSSDSPYFETLSCRYGVKPLPTSYSISKSILHGVITSLPSLVPSNKFGSLTKKQQQCCDQLPQDHKAKRKFENLIHSNYRQIVTDKLLEQPIGKLTTNTSDLQTIINIEKNISALHRIIKRTISHDNMLRLIQLRESIITNFVEQHTKRLVDPPRADLNYNFSTFRDFYKQVGTVPEEMTKEMYSHLNHRLKTRVDTLDVLPGAPKK